MRVTSERGRPARFSFRHRDIKKVRPSRPRSDVIRLETWPENQRPWTCTQSDLGAYIAPNSL